MVVFSSHKAEKTAACGKESMTGGRTKHRAPTHLVFLQVEESTRDESAYIERREEGKGGVSLVVSLLENPLELETNTLAKWRPVNVIVHCDIAFIRERDFDRS